MATTGIKETRDFFTLAKAIVAAIDAAKADNGKVDVPKDLTYFVSVPIPLFNAFIGAKSVPAELGDLDEAELVELKEEFGDIVDDERWQKLFYGLATAADAAWEISRK